MLARDANNPTLPVGLTRIDVPKTKDLEDDDWNGRRGGAARRTKGAGGRGAGSTPRPLPAS